jgi:hypothetical protein
MAAIRLLPIIDLSTMNRTSPIQIIFILGICIHGLTVSMGQEFFEIRGRAVDSDSGDTLPVRLYIESETGDFFHAVSGSREGKAIPYSKIRNNGSIEVHTSLSAHPFVAKLLPGEYTISAERGKEYLAASKQLIVS